MIEQLTVFLGNEKGRLTALCKKMGDAQIQMHALTVADTSDYGIVRIICDNPEKARKELTDAGFSANIAHVTAVQVPDVPGGSALVFEALDKADKNVEYAYCFATSSGAATMAVKADTSVATELENAGFRILYPKDLYKA